MRLMVSSAFSFGEAYHVTLPPGADPGELPGQLSRLGHGGVSVSRIEPSVEDYFMLLAGENNHAT